MATTRPAPQPIIHIPHTSRHHAHGHEASGEPRVRSILLSGGSRSAYARNGDQEAFPDHSSASREQRLPQRTTSRASTSRNDGALGDARTRRGSESGSQPEARPSSSASTSILLEEDLAAALASTPIPERTTTLDSPETPSSAMPHARPRMSLELPAADPVDMLFDADHKLSLEGTSPKPCIVPGNALHLIDDDPAAPRSRTPSSVIIIASEHDTDGDEDGETSEGGRTSSQPPARPMGPRVRFRSRVRITSGVHRHRHSTTMNGTPTPCSSASDSPSSSISAPLRYQADEHGSWGPLGKRLSAYAAGGGWPRRAHSQVSQTQHAQVGQTVRPPPGGRPQGAKMTRSYSERTPLMRPGRQRSYTEEEEDEETRGEEELTSEERALRAAALRREEEAVFGKWPWRIFNKHWWWWHVEPVLCCCCSDESDYDEF